MAERTWFGNRGAIGIGKKGDSSNPLIAIAKDIEVTVTGEFEELYGLGSTKRQDVAQHTKKVNVRFTIYKFDPASCPLWYIIDPDHTSGNFVLSDTSKVQLYNVDVYLDKDASTGNNVKLAISDVYFESLPFTVNDTEWIGLELEGVGASVTLSNTAAPSS